MKLWRRRRGQEDDSCDALAPAFGYAVRSLGWKSWKIKEKRPVQRKNEMMLQSPLGTGFLLFYDSSQ